MVDFSGKCLWFWSRGFVYQTKRVNACGHIPVRDLTMACSVSRKRRPLICGKSIHESFRGSSFGSIIVKENFQLKYLGLPRKWLTPKLRTANSKLYRRSQQGERNVTTCVQLFNLTNKTTWPKSLTFGATINCHSCLWIHSLPVLVVPNVSNQSLYLEPLISNHLSLAVSTTFRAKSLTISFVFSLACYIITRPLDR